MACPQKEHGYTAIANEIMEALARTRIPGESRQVLDVILRRTYGWNKKVAVITRKQFVLATALKGPNVTRAIKRLVEMNLICIKKDTDGAVRYRFNKDFDTWRSVSKKIQGIKNDTKGIKNDTKVVSKMIPPMPFKPNNGKHLQTPKTIFKTNIKQSLYRKRVLNELKTYFPNSRIPEHVPAERIDFFLYKIEQKEIQPSRVINPVAYIMSSKLVIEPFPSLLEREAEEERRKKEEVEKIKREREEMARRKQENLESLGEMRELTKSFLERLKRKGG